MELVVRELDIEEYRGKTYEFVYQTPGFYNFEIEGNRYRADAVDSVACIGRTRPHDRSGNAKLQYKRNPVLPPVRI